MLEIVFQWFVGIFSLISWSVFGFSNYRQKCFRKIYSDSFSSASFFLPIFFIIFLFFVACPQLTISGIGLIYAFTAPLFSSPSCCCIVSYRTVAVRERSMARLLTATTLVRSKFLLVSLFSYSLKKTLKFFFFSKIIF